MNGLLVGRFQPFHLGYVAAVGFALVRCDSLWLCIGSSNAEQGARNPFSVGERQEMIESSLEPDILERTRGYSVPDFDDHKKWIGAINATVPDYDVAYTSEDAATARMFQGRNKETIQIPHTDRGSLEGSGIRRAIASGAELGGLVPPGTARVLERIGARARLASFNYK